MNCWTITFNAVQSSSWNIEEVANHLPFICCLWEQFWITKEPSHWLAIFFNNAFHVSLNPSALIYPNINCTFSNTGCCHTSVIHIKGRCPVLVEMACNILTLKQYKPSRCFCHSYSWGHTQNLQHSSFICAMTGSLPCLVHQQISLFFGQRNRAMEFISNKCVDEIFILVCPVWHT